MTDSEAKLDLERAIRWGMFGSPPSLETMQHALQAMEDRAALVAVVEGAVPREPGYESLAVSAARRHMQGEP
jgi:hypothetical protein